MARIFTGYIDENDCIGDSLGDSFGAKLGTINGNSYSLDTAVQNLSAYDATLNQAISASGNNLTVANNLTVNNDLTASTIVVREEVYIQPAYATGGTPYTITENGISYRVHEYTTVGAANFEVSRPGEIEFLIVAGGGSGGNRSTTNANGGGGAGGVIHKAQHYIIAGIYPVVVGDGGAGLGYRVDRQGNNGENSTFLGYVAYGGGGGASSAGYSAQAGGSSGGGAWNYSQSGPCLQVDLSGARGYGNRGGNYGQGYTGCGGGGAGDTGIDGSGGTYWAGWGGRGMPFTITGTRRFFAGGGGGGGNSSEKAGGAWHGGGRGFGAVSGYYTYLQYPVEINSTTLGSGTPDAIPNTGGGGGAGSYWSNNTPQWPSKGSGKGGSGIVIVRYRL